MSNDHPPPTCLEAALAYLADGRSVIPVKTWLEDKNGKADKRPCVSWREFTRRLPTEDEVRGWWTQWPEAGVAIICGQISDMVVVDLDARAGADMDVSKWEDTLTVETPGGTHLVYSHPGEPVQPSAGRLGKGVDVRGDNSYIIAAPTKRCDGGEYKVSDPLPMAKYPYLKESQEELDLSFTPAESWAERALRDGVDEGGRNDTACRLAGLFAKRSFPEPAAVAQMLLWNQVKCNPPLPEQELVAVVKSIYHAERQKKAGERKNPDELPIQLLRFTDFEEKYGGIEIEWLIKDWVPKASIGFMVSPPECYKSWLTGDIAVSVSTGTPLLGTYPVDATGPVVVMQQEDHHGQTAERFRIQLQSRSEDGKSLPEGVENLWIQEDRDFHFDNKASMQRLEQMIERLRPALVIIDPLYACVDTADSMVRAARSMKPLKDLRDKYGTCFILVHHAGKSKTMDFDRERAWGSQFLNAFVEFGCQVAKPEDAQTLTKRHFKMCNTPGYVLTDWNINTRDGKADYKPTSRVVNSGQVDEIVAKYNTKRAGEAKAERNGGYELADPELTFEQVRGVLERLGPATKMEIANEMEVSPKDIDKLLKQLRSDGALVMKGRKWTLE